MKTRVRKEHFDTVKDTDLIGIKWKSGEKGVLINTKEGVVSLNTDEMDIRNCIAISTKSDYLTSEPFKRDQEKVYVFENLQPLLKWFAEE